ncbi:hypothetical protein BDR06DRAFT_967093 [Suillus hirtellus]|nr:hypothetical protein BDR06DRAFT_967093 [Suillus hirtellus]
MSDTVQDKVQDNWGKVMMGMSTVWINGRVLEGEAGNSLLQIHLVVILLLLEDLLHLGGAIVCTLPASCGYPKLKHCEACCKTEVLNESKGTPAMGNSQDSSIAQDGKRLYISWYSTRGVSPYLDHDYALPSKGIHDTPKQCPQNSSPLTKLASSEAAGVHPAQRGKADEGLGFSIVPADEGVLVYEGSTWPIHAKGMSVEEGAVRLYHLAWGRNGWGSFCSFQLLLYIGKTTWTKCLLLLSDKRQSWHSLSVDKSNFNADADDNPTALMSNIALQGKNAEGPAAFCQRQANYHNNIHSNTYFLLTHISKILTSTITP